MYTKELQKDTYIHLPFSDLRYDENLNCCEKRAKNRVFRLFSRDGMKTPSGAIKYLDIDHTTK